MTTSLHDSRHQLRLRSVRAFSGVDGGPVVVVALEHANVTREYSATDAGVVGALFAAIEYAFSQPAELLDYRLDQTPTDAEAAIVVTATVQIGPRLFTGEGRSDDIVEASAQALVYAFNEASMSADLEMTQAGMVG